MNSQIEWTLNILDIMVVILTILTIIITIYLAYHVQGIHSNLQTSNNNMSITHQHLEDIKNLLNKD